MRRSRCCGGCSTLGDKLATFQTGWFVEGLLTQLLAVIVLRARTTPWRGSVRPRGRCVGSGYRGGDRRRATADTFRTQFDDESGAGRLYAVADRGARRIRPGGPSGQEDLPSTSPSLVIAETTTDTTALTAGDRWPQACPLKGVSRRDTDAHLPHPWRAGAPRRQQGRRRGGVRRRRGAAMADCPAGAWHCRPMDGGDGTRDGVNRPGQFPYYAARSLLRMFAALALSLVFTFIYATAAARYAAREKVMLPILDILQSVPILGFLVGRRSPGSSRYFLVRSWAGMRIDLRDLHVAGLEYDIRVLPLADLAAARARRGRPAAAAITLAAILAR